MADLLRRTIDENIRLETVLAGGLWRTHADASQLENVLLNLCINARDAMPDGGKLTIEMVNAHLDEAYATDHADVPPGQYVRLAVTDTGIGAQARDRKGIRSLLHHQGRRQGDRTRTQPSLRLRQ